MKIYRFAAFAGCLALSVLFSRTQSQTKIVLCNGVLVTGYVYHGAFINIGRPSIEFAKKPYVISVGFLPTLQIKEDKVVANATKIPG